MRSNKILRTNNSSLIIRYPFYFNLNIVNFNISMHARFFDFISIINLKICL